MTKWNQQKLIQMTQQQNEFTKTKLNYGKIASNYFEIIEKTHKNGDLVPLAFQDVEIAYDGKIREDIILEEVSLKIQEQIEQKEQERQVMHIKHFSRSISHQAWFDYLDQEVDDFLDKYPEYDEFTL